MGMQTLTVATLLKLLEGAASASVTFEYGSDDRSRTEGQNCGLLRVKRETRLPEGGWLETCTEVRVPVFYSGRLSNEREGRVFFWLYGVVDRFIATLRLLPPAAPVEFQAGPEADDVPDVCHREYARVRRLDLYVRHPKKGNGCSIPVATDWEFVQKAAKA